MEVCEERVNTAGVFYSVCAKPRGMPRAMAMTPGQMLRKKLLECSRLFVKDIRGGESGCTRLSALFKEIIKIYDVHLVSGLGPKSQLPKLATWQEYAYVTSWLPTGTLGYNTPALP